MRCCSSRFPRRGFSNPSLKARRSEEHTSELQSPCNLVCRLLLEKKKSELDRIAHLVQEEPILLECPRNPVLRRDERGDALLCREPPSASASKRTTKKQHVSVHDS